MHRPASWAFFLLGILETCSKTVHRRELNKHILKSEWNKKEELDGQKTEKEMEMVKEHEKEKEKEKAKEKRKKRKRKRMHLCIL